MISGQVDRLRTAAQTYRRLGNHTAEGMFLEAADTICELQADNAMLREQLAKARDPQRIGGTADPESFVYAIEQLREFRWQHATNDEEAIPYINNVADAHERENAKLREQMERLVTLLRVDCDIDASWDGLRHFWSIELTEDGCLMRDRACKAEAENAKLREQIDAAHMSRLLTENENEKLRELCGFMLRCMKRNHDCDCCLVNGDHCEISYIESDARELGVEVSE